MSKVELYVYDLSNGVVKQFSKKAIRGYLREVEGDWHTSVVFHDKEVFYLQDIAITKPGHSQHGSPLQILNMGETEIDEETFDEYLEEIRERYTGDKCHLLDPDCHLFANDCIEFLTGESILGWISGLSSDFLSTPFAASLRKTIDATFRRVQPDVHLTSSVAASFEALQEAGFPSPSPAFASAILQDVYSRGFFTGSLSTPASLSQSPAPGSTTVEAPIHIYTNSSSLHELLQSHRAVIVFFTSETCEPCKMIEPAFEEIAHQKTKGEGRVAFVKVDMTVGMGSEIGAEWGVEVTPTFLFFLNARKMHELKGEKDPELVSTQVDLVLYQAFPPHPHTKLSLPAVEAFPTDPILFAQVPPLDKVSCTLTTSLDTIPSNTKVQAAQNIVSKVMVSFLKARFPEKAAFTVAPKESVPATAQLLTGWASSTLTIADALPAAQIFPLADMWRLAVLDENVANWLACPSPSSVDALDALLSKALATLDSADPTEKTSARNYLLTLLRMIANGFEHAKLCTSLLSANGKREKVTGVLVATLLHQDAAVRREAASLAFNVAAVLQKSRVSECIPGAETGQALVVVVEDEEWEVELVCAVLEALSNEVQSEEVVHRLVAALAFFLRLSPSYGDKLAPLLELLSSSSMLNRKLERGGCGENGVQNPDVRKLVKEVAEKLCPEGEL